MTTITARTATSAAIAAIARSLRPKRCQGRVWLPSSMKRSRLPSQGSAKSLGDDPLGRFRSSGNRRTHLRKRLRSCPMLARGVGPDRESISMGCAARGRGGCDRVRRGYRHGSRRGGRDGHDDRSLHDRQGLLRARVGRRRPDRADRRRLLRHRAVTRRGRRRSTCRRPTSASISSMARRRTSLASTPQRRRRGRDRAERPTTWTVDGAARRVHDRQRGGRAAGWPLTAAARSSPSTAAQAETFTFVPAEGCAIYPEISLNASAASRTRAPRATARSRGPSTATCT